MYNVRVFIVFTERRCGQLDLARRSVSLRGHGSFVRLSSFSLQALLLVSIKDRNEHEVSSARSNARTSIPPAPRPRSACN